MMGSKNVPEQQPHSPLGARLDGLILWGIAAIVILIHLLTNNRYGFHRDELQFLSDARHLDWGFVAYPPVTPFLQRLGLEIFGVSLVGLRLFSVLAQAMALLVTGWMTRELGGRSLAQVTAALMVALSPLPLFEGTEFQYSTFDYLWWVLISYFVIRLLKTEDPRWWLAIGSIAGIGFMTKYTMLFFIAGLLGGLILTQSRRYLASGWFWAGVSIGLLIFLPNVIWQFRHGLISLHFLQHIHARDVRQGRADDFFRDQFLICTNVVAAPVWIAGLISFLRDRRYRLLGWMYLIPLALFALGKGRGYYLAAAYPMLMAMGATTAERWAQSLPKLWRRMVEVLFFAGLIACGLYIGALVLPLANTGPLREFALKRNGDLREEIGWKELTTTVAGIRDSLLAEQRADVGIVVGNYGEQGAIEIFGPPLHLPTPISMTNSAWLRGYPVPPPSTLIVVGFSQEAAEKAFTSCQLAGHNVVPGGVKNEESQFHRDIFVCGPPRLPWPQFWKEYQSFG
jgi:hypothetical protein